MAKLDQEKLGELLSAYLDDEVALPERQLVERLLREDPTARRLMDDLQRGARLVYSLPRHPAPPSIAVEIQQRLEREALLGEATPVALDAIPHAPRWWAQLAMAAVLTFTALGTWWFLRDDERSNPIPVVAPLASSEESRREINAPARKSAEREPTASKQEIVPGPPLDTKLAHGAQPETVLNHSFASEPVVLQVAAATPKDRTALVGAVVQNLRSQNVGEFKGIASQAPGAQISADASFYLDGKPGVNYDARDEQQILVRAPRSQVDSLLTSLSHTPTANSQVQLKAGDVIAQGIEPGRRVLQIIPGSQAVTQATSSTQSSGAKRARLLDEKDAPTIVMKQSEAHESPAPPDALSASSRSPRAGVGYFGPLLKAIGIDPVTLSRQNSNAVADSTGDARASEQTTDGSGKEMKASTARDSQAKPDENAPSGARLDDAKPTSPASLVERNQARLEQKAKAQSAKMNALSQPASQSSSPAMQAAEDPLITMVIEVMVQKPAQSPPPAPAKAKQEPQQPANRSKS